MTDRGVEEPKLAPRDEQLPPPVDVHRLLAEDSVDQRMLEVLGGKAALFDEHVRRSESKDVSPDAVNVSDLAAIARGRVAGREGAPGIEMERKRLQPDRASDVAS